MQLFKSKGCGRFSRHNIY